MTRHRLHVLVVPAWYPSPTDPVTGVFVREQARAIAGRSDVTVLAPPNVSPSREYEDDSVRVLRFAPARGTRRMIALARMRALSATVARLRSEGCAPDVLHAHFFSAGVPAVLVGRRRRLPVVLSEHLSDIQENEVVGWDAIVARFTYRHADLVCPVSARLASSIKRLESRTRCEVVENVVDVDYFASFRRNRADAHGCRLLAVARLVHKKGLPDLITATRVVIQHDPGITLEIIGDGPDRPTLERLAAGLPVTFLGARARDEVAARMRQADILVVPSRVETFGIPAIEGLAAGLQVVVTDAVPVADVVAELGGVVTRADDPTSLADGLAKAIDQPRPTGSGDLEQLRWRFGAQAIGARWESIYNTVVSRSATGRARNPRRRSANL